jgi:hypothetical protein
MGEILQHEAVTSSSMTTTPPGHVSRLQPGAQPKVFNELSKQQRLYMRAQCYGRAKKRYERNAQETQRETERTDHTNLNGLRKQQEAYFRRIRVGDHRADVGRGLHAEGARGNRHMAKQSVHLKASAPLW